MLKQGSKLNLNDDSVDLYFQNDVVDKRFDILHQNSKAGDVKVFFYLNLKKFQ